MKSLKLTVSIFCLLFCSLCVKAQWNNKFITTLNELHYDSVKVFYFNCVVDTATNHIRYISIRTNSRLIDEKQNWINIGNQKGKTVQKNDLKLIFNALVKNNKRYKARFNKPVLINSVNTMIINEPVGCYQPRMGFAFYSKGLVNAHLDVCLECNKAQMEIFGSETVIKHEEWSILVDETLNIFKLLCNKYEMLCCGKAL